MDSLIKLLVAIVSSLGTVLAANWIIPMKKTRLKLLKEFDAAVKSGSRNSVTDIFHMLYGLRMSYNDILTLIEDDDVSKKIFALRKVPGMVQYEKGQLSYSKLFSKRILRSVNFLSSYLMIVLVGILIVLFIIALRAVRNIVLSIIIFSLIIFLSFILSFLIKEHRFDKTINKLIRGDDQDKV